MEDALKVEVCCNTYGMLRGAMDIIDQIETLNDIVDELHLDRPIEVVPVGSLEGSEIEDNCPVAKVGDTVILNATSQNVMEKILDQTGGGEYK